MKDRVVWAFLVFALLVLGGIYLLRNRPAKPSMVAPATATAMTSAPANNPVPTTAAVSQPAPAVAPDTGPMLQLGRGGQKVPVQEGKTIDMSSGRPVVRDDAHSRAVIEKSVREMAEAAKSVTFSPTAGQVVSEKKKEESAPSAPKP